MYIYPLVWKDTCLVTGLNMEGGAYWVGIAFFSPNVWAVHETSTVRVYFNPYVWRRWRKKDIEEENIKVRVKYYIII